MFLLHWGRVCVFLSVCVQPPPSPAQALPLPLVGSSLNFSSSLCCGSKDCSFFQFSRGR